ncbi:MAG: cupin domain-containing protein [bacterium]|nr:cupin domain-containing protein [bacterium]
MQVIKKTPPQFVDDRGGITSILSGDNPDIKSILFITSKAGSVRSNHYHKKDAHYCYIISGKAEWREQPVAGGEVESRLLEAGDMVFTPPMIKHTVKFLEDTVFFAFATESRLQDDYEADTIRVEQL